MNNLLLSSFQVVCSGFTDRWVAFRNGTTPATSRDAGQEGRFSPGAFDSLSAVELSNAVGAALDLQLPSTLAFDYPSLHALAAHVHSLLVPPPAGMASTNTADALVSAAPRNLFDTTSDAFIQVGVHLPAQRSMIIINTLLIIVCLQHILCCNTSDETTTSRDVSESFQCVIRLDYLDFPPRMWLRLGPT